MKIQNVVNHFWERWRKEYLTSLREYQKIVQPNDNLPMIKIGDIVIVHEKSQPRAIWRMGKIEEVIKGIDGHIRGAVVRISKTNSLIKRPINLLYPIEYKDSSSYDQDIPVKEVQHQRPRREAAIIGELKRKWDE